MLIATEIAGFSLNIATVASELLFEDARRVRYIYCINEVSIIDHDRYLNMANMSNKNEVENATPLTKRKTRETDVSGEYFTF